MGSKEPRVVIISGRESSMSSRLTCIISCPKRSLEQTNVEYCKSGAGKSFSKTVKARRWGFDCEARVATMLVSNPPEIRMESAWLCSTDWTRSCLSLWADCQKFPESCEARVGCNWLRNNSRRKWIHWLPGVNQDHLLPSAITQSCCKSKAASKVSWYCPRC